MHGEQWCSLHRIKQTNKGWATNGESKFNGTAYCHCDDCKNTLCAKTRENVQMRKRVWRWVDKSSIFNVRCTWRLTLVYLPNHRIFFHWQFHTQCTGRISFLAHFQDHMLLLERICFNFCTNLILKASICCRASSLSNGKMRNYTSNLICVLQPTLRRSNWKTEVALWSLQTKWWCALQTLDNRAKRSTWREIQCHMVLTDLIL